MLRTADSEDKLNISNPVRADVPTSTSKTGRPEPHSRTNAIGRPVSYSGGPPVMRPPPLNPPAVATTDIAPDLIGLTAPSKNSYPTDLYLNFTNREDMLGQLRNAGVDVADICDQTGEQIADYIIAKRNQREPDGSISYPGLARARNRKPNKWVPRGRARKAEKQAIQDLGDTTPIQASKHPGHMQKHHKKFESGHYSLGEARSHLFAIKRQAILDANGESFPEYEDFNLSDLEIGPVPNFSYGTILYDNSGNALYTYEAQGLIRKILQHRDTVRNLEGQRSTLDKKATKDLESSTNMHRDLCTQLVTEVESNIGEEGFQKHVEVTKMIGEIFAV